MIQSKKIFKKLAILISIALMMMTFSVPSFATDTVTTSNATLIGSTPYAGASNVAPGSNNAIQPIRLAFSEDAEMIGANINAYVTLENVNIATSVAITASVSENIVTLMPSSALAANTKYKVDFDNTKLNNIADFTFTTAKGGTGGGTGSGTQGSQALVLTGKIPTDNAVISGSQEMYFTFSTNIRNNPDNTINADNNNCFTVETPAGQSVAATVTVSIIDNWTAKVVVTGLASGSYQVTIDGDLMAKSENTLGSDVVIPFTVA